MAPFWHPFGSHFGTLGLILAFLFLGHFSIQKPRTKMANGGGIAGCRLGGGFIREPDSGGFRSAFQTPCPMEWGGGSRGAARNPATVPDRCSPSTNTIGQNTQINGALKPKRETKWLDTCDAQMDSLGSKSSPNGSKMMPKWYQKRSREGPGGVLEATWAPDGPQSRPGVILA